MSEPKVYDVAPLVITREKDDGKLDGKPELVKSIAKEMRKDLGKKEWARAAEFAAQDQRVNFEDFSKKSAMMGADVEDNRDSQDYGKIKLDGDGNELKFQKKIKDAEEFARAFFEKGYDKLDLEQKIALRTHIIEQAMRIPLVSDRVRGMTEDEKIKFAERLINNATFAGELKKVYNDALEKPFTNNVVESFEDYQEAKNGLNIVEEEYKVIEAQAANTTRRLKTFELDPEGKPAPGAINAIKLEELRHGPENNPAYRKAQIAQLEEQLITADSEVNSHMADQQLAFKAAQQMNPALFKEDPSLRPLKQARGETEVDIIEFQSQMTEEAKKDNEGNIVEGLDDKAQSNAWNTAKRNLLAAQAKLKRQDTTIKDRLEESSAAMMGNMQIEGVGNLKELTESLKEARNRAIEIRQKLAKLKGYEEELRALEAEQSEVQESSKRLEQEKREVLQRKQVEEMKVNRALRKYEEAKSSRLSEEEILAEELEKAGGSAASAILANELREATVSYDAMFDKVIQGSRSNQETALFVTLRRTWLGNEKTLKSEGLWGKRKKETSNPINKAQVLRDYNLLLRGGDVALTRSLIKRTINPDTQKPFEDDEINDMFDKNPTLIEKFKPEAIKQLLARKALVGGFTPEDSYSLVSEPWGQAAMESAYNQNEAFRNLVDRNSEEGALRRHGFWQRFGQEMAKHPFWWTILLGIPAIFKTTGSEPNRDTLDGQR